MNNKLINSFIKLRNKMNWLISDGFSLKILTNPCTFPRRKNLFLNGIWITIGKKQPIVEKAASSLCCAAKITKKSIVTSISSVPNNPNISKSHIQILIGIVRTTNTKLKNHYHLKKLISNWLCLKYCKIPTQSIVNNQDKVAFRSSKNYRFPLVFYVT